MTSAEEHREEALAAIEATEQALEECRDLLREARLALGKESLAKPRQGYRCPHCNGAVAPCPQEGGHTLLKHESGMFSCPDGKLEVVQQ